MPEPSIVAAATTRANDQQAIAATGRSFDIYEWSGSGPDPLHVHYADEEAWHILNGTLTFRFNDKQVDVTVGTTVSVPVRVPHSYFDTHGTARSLISMTPRLRGLISAFRSAPREEHNEIMHRFDSEILE